jgi:hypothetical protein
MPYTTGGTLHGMNKSSVYLDDRQRAELRRLAELRGLSQADLIREAIEALIDKTGPGRPISIGSGASDGALPAREAKTLVRSAWGGAAAKASGGGHKAVSVRKSGGDRASSGRRTSRG